MGEARRMAGLPMLSAVLAVAAITQVTAFTQIAAAAPFPPVRHMNFACASRGDGLMRFLQWPLLKPQLKATARPQCGSQDQRLVRMAPGPVRVCVHADHEVFLAAGLCRRPSNLAALTLPSQKKPVYFCASDRTHVLTYPTNPRRCNSGAFLAVVSAHSVLTTPMAPVLAKSGGLLTYFAGAPPIRVTPNLTVTSPSTTTLVSATVRISSGFVKTEDSLSFTNQNGITGSYNAATGVLTLSGRASVANYQAALRSVGYRDSNGLSPALNNRVISVQVNDGLPTHNLSNTVSRPIEVKPNIRPTAGNVTASTDKHTATDINVLASASDPDGDILTVTAVNTTGTKGTVSINPDGTIHYDPNGQFTSLTAGQTATDTFGYTVSDGFHTASATVTVTITGVNDPPVISNIETSPLSYQAQRPAVAITSTLTLSDDDDTTMSSATVSITAGFSAADDLLSFTNQNGIIGSYNAATGVLTLSGNASIADYQTALRSVQFSTSDNSASPAARTVSFAVTDSLGATSTGTAQRTIDVAAANQPPVLANIEAGTLLYEAGTPPVPVTSSLTVTSSSTTTLAGATVTIGSGFVSSEDTLSFTNQNGITGSYNAAIGVLTLSGTASVADYQTALRSVTFSDPNGTSPTTGNRTISFQVDDGQATENLSNVVSRTVDVEPNNPPVAGNVSASTDKHTAIDINVLASASDPDGDTVNLTAVDTTGTKGTVSINPNSTIHYDPNGQFNGLLAGQTATDTFGYTVSDGFHTTSATVTVTINGVNDPPVLAGIEAGTLQYDAGTPPAQITSSLTVSSPDTASLAGATVTISSGFVSSEDTLSFIDQNGITGAYNAATGVLTLSGTATVADYQTALRSVTFSDSNGASPTTGNRVVSFQVDDGLGSNNLSNVESRTISVNPNSPPVAGNVSASTDKHTATDINVLASASDPDGDPVSVTAVNTTGTKGTVSINPNGTIHYDPNGQFTSLTAGQTATDTFGYTVSDGFHTASATVTVTITGVNDPPVVANIEAGALSYRAQDPAVQITNTLTLSDDDDATMSSATVSITAGFSAADDLLSFTNQNGIIGSYNASTGVLTLSGNASIADYQTALRSVQFSTSDNSASPAARTVSFAVTDSVGATSTGPAQRTINVAEANQPPVAVNQSYTAVGNTPLGVGTSPAGPAATVPGSVLKGDSDPDSGGSISLTGNTNPAHGTVTMNPDGTFTYVPNAGFSGTDSFTYTITDSDDPLNPKSATATVTITVGPVVWYVDNSNAAAGNGEAGSPFNTLAAANSAAGANSIIFLYQGNATYTGGVSMKSGEDLFGQPFGLTVDGFALVPAGGSTPTITNSGGDGIDLGAGSDVEAVNVSSPSGNGVSASGVNSATVGGTDAVAISGAGGDGVHVSGGNGNLNFTGVSVTGSAGHSVSIASHTGGVVSFGGSITDNGTGISLSGNAGASIGFGGKLTLSTGAHTAFSATGGGTVTASASGNTIGTTTATALSVQNTTIGASGLLFQSISSNGANPGISLSSTGSSGGLTVTGTGTAGSGGTIQGSAGNGITLSSTTSPSFTDMLIKNNAADGINGTQVNGLTLASSTVSGNGTPANVSGANDDGLDFSPTGASPPDGLTGTVTISNSTITGSADDNAIISDTSGSLNLTVTGSTFSSDSASEGNDGLHVDANGSTNATVSVTGSTFTNNKGDHFQFETDSSATGTDSVTFSNNTLTTTVSGVLGGGMQIDPFGNSHTTATVDGNNIQGAVFSGITLDENGTSGTLSGTVHGNTIGTAAVANSGSSEGDDIGVSAEGAVTETLAITGNNLFQYNNTSGISFSEQGSATMNPTMNLTITGNTIADPSPQFSGQGLIGSVGVFPTDLGTVCAAISGNSMTGSGGNGAPDFELDQTGNTTIELPGYAGPAHGSGGLDPAVVTFVQSNNNSGGTPSGAATDGGSGGGFTGATSCPTP